MIYVKIVFDLIKKYYFPLLLFVYFFYLLLLIYRTTFYIDGKIYFSLFDDEMVSMRYAKNFAMGNGLTWNIGERIEGFSNPLWTFYMSFWHLFGISARFISAVMQFTNVLLLLVNLYFVKKISEIVFNKNLLATIVSVFFTAFYFSINNWAILGTETTPLMLIATVSVYLLIKNKFSTLPYFLMAIGILIRLDFTVFYIAFLLTNYYIKKQSVRSLIDGIFILILVIALQFIFRLSYFHEFLPNTYFLKMTGFPVVLRIMRGAYSFAEFIFKSGIIFLIPLFYFIKIPKKALFLLPFIIMQILYSIYVGGDVWEYFGGSNRYITIIMPLYFVVFGYLFYKLYNVKKSLFFKSGLIISVMFVFIIQNSAGKDMMRDFLGLAQHQTVGASKLNTQKALFIEKNMRHGSIVALDWAGVMPYFANDMHFIDLLGKNDKYVAHLDSNRFVYSLEKPAWEKFLPGHTKWDYNYSLYNKEPDVIAQFPMYLNDSSFIKNNYYEVHVGDDSIYIHKDTANLLNSN